MNCRFFPAVFVETTDVLANPYCGFYTLLPYVLDETQSEKDAAWWISYYIEGEACSLILLEVNLRSYSARALSAAALQKLDDLLAAAARCHKKLILRPLYDWDGTSEATEPADLALVKTHIAQTSEIVNQYTDTVFLVQGCFVGAYGEMHSGAFCDIPTIKDLMRKMSIAFDPSIFLAVRTPAMQRSCTENALSVTKKNAFDGTFMSRLGLFNDGMLGSETDLGTYSVIESDDDFTQKGTRAQELAFEDQLSTYIPSGGEAVIVNPMSAYPACIEDLMRKHVSYLNRGYDPDLLAYWKATPCTITDTFHPAAFTDQTVYHHIAAHLGYRYLITQANAKLSGRLRPRIDINITIQNHGFSPAYRKFETKLTLICQENGSVTETVLPFDNRYLAGNGERGHLTVSIPLSDLKNGTWDLYLTMIDPTTGDPIALANEASADHPSSVSTKAVHLGTLTLW